MSDSKKKLISLDILRGLACLLVWVSHIRVATGYFKYPAFDFMQIFAAWGREAVLIFFILSGIVINLSSQNRTSRWEYFKKRITRIYPIYLAVFLICFLSDHFIFGNTINSKVFAGNLFLLPTLQGYFVPTMPLNPAVWSISCEAFFYFFFGLIYKFNRPRWVWIWFVVSCLSIVYSIIDNEFHTGIFYHIIFLLNNSFLWILGYFVFEYRDKFQTALPVAVCGILMVPLVTRLHKFPPEVSEFMYSLAGIYLLPLFIYLLKNHGNPTGEKTILRHYYLLPFYILNVYLLWHYSNSLYGSKVLYSILPVLALALYFRPVVAMIKWTVAQTQTIFIRLADISYPVYLVHMPVLYITFHFLPNQQIAGTVIAICLTLPVSYIFEIYLFKKLTFIMRKGT